MQRNLAASKVFTKGKVNYNACVGNNGWTDIEVYGRGFDKSVEVLCKSIISDSSEVDSMIYPIVFSARHRIELYLKQCICGIGEIRKEFSVLQNKLIKTHDLQKLWEKFSENAKKCDARFHKYINEQEHIILEFAAIDLTGETFRYPYSQDNIKHLESVSLINVEVFYEHYKKLSVSMEYVSGICDELKYEYSLKSFTKKLSRAQISEIALLLPDCKAWGGEQLTIAKAEIVNKFEISGRDFSDALALIKVHREFSSKIGVEIPITHISPDKLEMAFVAIENEDSQTLEQDFNKDELACLCALHELYVQKEYSEVYEYFFEQNHKGGSKEDLARNLISKRNFAECIEDRLELLGQKTLLDIDYYKSQS